MAEESTAAAAQTIPQEEGLEDREGKYLTFVLGEEEYGLGILNVREILGMMPVTAVPQTPEFVKGVINLRGKVIPVVDLRLKFSLPEIEYGQETCVIVVEVGGVQMGIIVDAVQEVLDIAANQIEDPPRFGSQVDTEFILGMGKVGDKVKILLDIERVLSGEALVTASRITGEEPRAEERDR